MTHLVPLTPEHFRTIARAGMLQWRCDVHWGIRARLGLHDAAREIERLQKLLDEAGIER